MTITSPIIIFFARWFPWIVIGTGCFFFAYVYKHRAKQSLAEAMSTGGAMFITWVIVVVIKNTMNIPRPFIVNGMDNHFFVDGYTSFPSGHAALFFALATGIYLNNKKVGIGFFIAAIMISAARVLVGVHYVRDILAGAAIGVAVAYLFYKLVNSIFSRKNL